MQSVGRLVGWSVGLNKRMATWTLDRTLPLNESSETLAGTIAEPGTS
jgi:hypothetical protein